MSPTLDQPIFLIVHFCYVYIISTIVSNGSSFISAYQLGGCFSPWLVSSCPTFKIGIPQNTKCDNLASFLKSGHIICFVYLCISQIVVVLIFEMTSVS